MKNKKALRNFKYKYDLSNHAMAVYAGKSTYTIGRWLNSCDKDYCPSDEDLERIQREHEQHLSKSHWWGKKGIEAVIANMYAVERMG